MKRPLFTVGCTYLAAMAVAFYFGYAAALLLIPLLGLFAFLTAGDKSQGGKSFFVILITGIVALSVSVGFTMLRYAPVTSLYGKTVMLEGTIFRAEQSGTMTNYVVCGHFDGINFPGGNDTQVMLRAFGELDARVGDGIRIPVKLSPPTEYDYNDDYYLSTGIFASAFVSERPIVLEEAPHKLLSSVARYRQKLMASIDRYIQDDRNGLMNAILFGENYEIGDDVRYSFNRSGIAHILAVSGLHLIIVVNIVSGMLTMVLGKRRSDILSLFVPWVFVLFGGMGYALVRSAIMLTVYFLGNLLGKKNDGLSSLGLAGLLMATINPYAIGNLSFQLSFLSTMGILLLTKPIANGIYNHVLYAMGEKSQKLAPIVNIISITIAAQIFAAPVLAFHFGFLSLISPLTNLLIAPIVPIVLSMGLVTALSGALGAPVVMIELFGNITTLGIEVIVKISDAMATIPYASIYINHTYLLVWFGGVVLAALWLYTIRANIQLIKYGAALGIFTLLVGVTSHTIFTMNTVDIVTFENSATIAVLKNNRAVIIGLPTSAFTARQVVEVLDSHQVDAIDLMIVTGAETVTGNGTSYLLANRKVEYIIAPEISAITDYFTFATDAQLFPFTQMEIEMLGGVNCKLIPSWGITIEVNENSILKIFDDYDIMKGKDTEAEVIVDNDGMSYIKRHNNTMRVRKTMNGNTIFTLRE